MAVQPDITVKVSADTTDFTNALDVVVKHLTALSADLKALNKHAALLASDIKAASQ